jgi:hypothetical protein
MKWISSVPIAGGWFLLCRQLYLHGPLAEFTAARMQRASGSVSGWALRVAENLYLRRANVFHELAKLG